jgi:uncharacterized protein YhbP (UPF0306 family)
MDVEKVIREYIDKSIHMSLGTSRDNKPWVCEVHFVYDDRLNLYFRSLKSRRHSQDIALNPNVAGNIVKQHTVDEYPHAIYFEGSASLVDDEQKRQKLFGLFKDRLNANEDILEEAKLEDGHQFYEVVVTNWYAFGKFGQPSGQKYELSWNGGE